MPDGQSLQAREFARGWKREGPHGIQRVPEGERRVPGGHPKHSRSDLFARPAVKGRFVGQGEHCLGRGREAYEPCGQGRQARISLI